MNKVVIFFLLIIAFFSLNIGAQELSEKKDVAVFKINYFGAPAYAPTGVKISASLGKDAVNVTIQGSGNRNADAIFGQTVAQVDASIQQSLQDLGRFNIISMPQRLATDDVGAFIEQIKRFKTDNLVIPEAVSFGRQTFTEADFNKLVGSFIILVPTIVYYNLVYNPDSALYEAEIKTDISVIDVAAGTEISRFAIETQGSDANDARAMKKAVDAIPMDLIFELRSVPAFRISSGITGFQGGDVIMEFGSGMGIQIGDEYHITRTSTVGRYNTEENAGLLIVKEVNRDFSIAQIIRMNGKAVLGDQLRELPREGVDLELYGDLLLPSEDVNSVSGLLLGAKAALTRGYYSIRPILGVDLLLSDSLSVYGSYLPIAAYAGAEYVMYLGFLKVVPQANVGLVYFVNGEELFDAANPTKYLSHVRAQVKAQLAYLLNDDTYLFVEGGVLGHLSLNTSYFPTFSNTSVGAGVSFKL